MPNLKKAILTIASLLCFTSSYAQSVSPNLQYVDVGSLKVAYTEVGQGAPIVLLHGGGLTSKMWSEQVEALAKHYRVILPDTRGHGKTENPDHVFHYKQLAQDVANFCRALSLERPIVMGYSDGGITALTLAVHHPNVARAFVIGGAVPPQNEKDIAHYFKGMDLFYAPLTKRTALEEADLDQLYASAPQMWDFMAKMHAKPNDPDKWRTLMKDVWVTWNEPQAYRYLNDELTKTTVPMLFILGDRDEFFRAESAARLVSTLPNAELAVMPGATHNAFKKKPKLFNALVMDFLARTKSAQ